ncbi:FKBP-type peptidyl-prolyl cis-trans isomerase [Nocardioides sp. GXQ0305]|uniref:FKBP-type peptidyl-prolyl cis-trans isomerase n=1 Tax=Nocardioides sp. GXQ0305 TaxID=3423912 RepID=UPI003D7CD2D7
MLRRLLPLPLTLLLGATLVACGDDSGDDGSSSSSAAGLESLTIDGEVGDEPQVTFDGQVQADEVETEVVEEGDGEEVETGDSVLTQIWIGNGYQEEKAFSTYDADTPQLFTVDEKMLSPFFLAGLEGQKIGSRVAVAASAETAFGEAGNAQLGIGNKDSVVAVIDLLSSVPDGPEGQEQKAPSWAPGLQGDEEAPTGLDFSGTPKPDGSLKSAYLIEGEGEKVEKGQTIVVDYLGQVYGGKKPFDESFSAQPTSFQIGVGGVVKGWDQTLVGVPVGSRVIMAIPPKLGYGEKGNPQAGIKGTDTLYFVVDVLAAN